MPAIAQARQCAFETLLAVEEGAYASDELRSRSAQLASRDASLASQIVFGTLRLRLQLDHLLAQYSGRRPVDLDPAVRIALQAAIFQLRYLDRIPPHAAVHDSVEFVKRRCRAATGLTNAVLRKVNRDPPMWPDAATELSCPTWLLRRWIAAFGEETASRIAQTALQEPAAYIRIPRGGEIPETVTVEPTEIPGCFRVVSAPARSLRFHDISSQSIVPLLDLRPGDSFLDLCAAPGNKTRQALESPLTFAVACDLSPERLADVPPQAARLVLDAAEGLPFSQKFTRVLVDAPCSGTGTLARNPEIKWRIAAGDFARYSQKQRRILANALRCLAPGGVLVYATCSLEHEENEDVVSQTLQTVSNASLIKDVYRLPGRDEGDGFYAAVITVA